MVQGLNYLVSNIGQSLKLRNHKLKKVVCN
jgi:hypothetical protein